MEYVIDTVEEVSAVGFVKIGIPDITVSQSQLRSHGNAERTILIWSLSSSFQRDVRVHRIARPRTVSCEKIKGASDAIPRGLNG